MLKLLAMLLDAVLSLFKWHSEEALKAQVDAEEKNEEIIANAPRDDDAFAKQLRRYEDHTF